MPNKTLIYAVTRSIKDGLILSGSFGDRYFLLQAEVNATAYNLCFKPCALKHNYSLTLSPHFWDIIMIKEYIQDCSEIPEARQVKDILVEAKHNKEKQGVFAYKDLMKEVQV